jgi:hypothetical protein
MQQRLVLFARQVCDVPLVLKNKLGIFSLNLVADYEKPGNRAAGTKSGIFRLYIIEGLKTGTDMTRNDDSHAGFAQCGLCAANCYPAPCRLPELSGGLQPEAAEWPSQRLRDDDGQTAKRLQLRHPGSRALPGTGIGSL